MERELAIMKQKEDKVLSLDRDFQKLLDAGLLVSDAEGNVNCVESW